MDQVHYIVSLPIQSMCPGDRYSSGEQLPLNCTLMPWFGPGRFDQTSFGAGLAKLAAEIREPINLVSARPDMFGADNTVPVYVLERDPALLLLHTKLFRFLSRWGCCFPELRWVGAGYNPHVTDREGECFNSGMHYGANCCVLIEREGTMRRVLSLHWFGSHRS